MSSKHIHNRMIQDAPAEDSVTTREQSNDNSAAVAPKSRIAYHDFSRATFSTSDALGIKEPAISTFPMKLHEILSNEEFSSIVSWLPHGRAWRVIQQKQFEKKIIPLYFRHGRFSSFARQVNGWGFRRIVHGPDYNSYYHELFLRGMPHLCQRMKRLTPQDIADRQKEHETDVPDFYAISQVNPLPKVGPPFPSKTTMTPSKNGDAVETSNMNERSTTANKEQSYTQSTQEFSARMQSSEIAPQQQQQQQQQQPESSRNPSQDSRVSYQSFPAYQPNLQQQASIRNTVSVPSQNNADLAALQQRRDHLLSRIVNSLTAQVSKTQSTDQLEMIATCLSMLHPQGGNGLQMEQQPLPQNPPVAAPIVADSSQDRLQAIVQLLRGQNPQQIEAPPAPAPPPAQNQTSDILAKIKGLIANHQEAQTRVNTNSNPSSRSIQTGIPTQISVQQKETPSFKDSAAQSLGAKPSVKTAGDTYTSGSAHNPTDFLQQLINQARSPSHSQTTAHIDQQKTITTRNNGNRSMMAAAPQHPPQQQGNQAISMEPVTTPSPVDLLNSLLGASGGQSGLQALLESHLNRKSSTQETAAGNQLHSETQPFSHQEQDRERMDMSNRSQVKPAAEALQQLSQAQQPQPQHTQQQQMQQAQQQQRNYYASNTEQGGVNTEMLQNALNNMQDPQSRALLQQLFRRAT